MKEIEGQAYWVYFSYALSTMIFAYCCSIYMYRTYNGLLYEFGGLLSTNMLTGFIIFGFVLSAMGAAFLFLLLSLSASLEMHIKIFDWMSTVWHILILFMTIKLILVQFSLGTCLIALYWCFVNLVVGSINPLRYESASVLLTENGPRQSLNEDKRNSILAVMSNNPTVLKLPLEFDI